MKKIIILFFAVINSLAAQEFSATELLDNIMEVQSMRELSKFREELVRDLKNLNMENITPEEHGELGVVYEKMRVEYNTLIGMIKQDVLDFKNIKKLTKSSNELSTRYKGTIEKISTTYNNEFLPMYAEMSTDRSLLALIFPYIEKGIRFIIDFIREKKLKKETLLNELLNVTNNKFNDCLVLPSWNTLTKQQSINKTAKLNTNTYSEPVVQSKEVQVNDIQVSEIKSKSSKLSSVPLQVEPVVIEYPAMKELVGNIEFVISNEAGNTEPMIFDLPTSLNKNRDLKVGSKNGTAISNTAFGSRNQYANGISFQMRITNTAFVYVFAFNSDNTCYPIYPYSTDWVRDFNMEQTRDLGVGPLMMKDDNNLLVIPSKNSETGLENYIQITGTSSKEQLCLILSKSELDLQQVCNTIDNSVGTLTDRLSAALNTTNVATFSDVELTQFSTGIKFKSTKSDKWVLPLIFEIKRI